MHSVPDLHVSSPSETRLLFERLVRGGTFRRGESGYEAARQQALWNARLPDRFPDVIVQANDEQEAVAAVRMARREDLRIAVRSGGHSWSGNHIRDGGLLLDLSRLNQVSIDEAAKEAVAGPGCRGDVFASLLASRRLFFPTGHCKGVCIGGYLLQGGFGWHGRALGPACESILAVDVITADGEIVHASPEENPDLYWAARGAGPGFFGAVIRFHLQLYDRPPVIGFAAQTFRMDWLEKVFGWAHAIGPDVPGSVELQLLMCHDPPGVRGPGIIVFAPVFAESIRQANRDVSFLTDGPIRWLAAHRLPFIPCGQALMYRGVMQHYPDNHRYAVDNMWTSASFEALLPGLRRIADTLPPAPSHVLWMNWAPPPVRPAMAFSMEDDIYLALYAVWKNPWDDGRFASWPVDRMREMEELATGCQLADENLGEHPARFVSDAHLARLDALRARYDPETRFFPWMGRPGDSPWPATDTLAFASQS